jgi:hypothetical protein
MSETANGSRSRLFLALLYVFTGIRSGILDTLILACVRA